LRLKLSELLEVASVGHDGGELFEGVELVHEPNYQAYRPSMARD
jgi:hypothetical protein